MKGIEQKIEENIYIDRHKIVTAKAHIMNLSIEEEINLSTEMKRFSASQGFPVITELKTYEDNAVAKASGNISWSMAFAYAALELINANQLIPTSPYLAPNNITIPWSNIRKGSGGTRSTFSFPKCAVPMPNTVIKPKLQGNDYNFTLFNPDLFVSHMEIPNAHEDIKEALYDAIDCFKAELYRPTLTMLGKAVEGAWIELGVSLTSYAIENMNDVEKNMKLKDKLMGFDSIANKVEKIIDLYSSHHKDWFDGLRKETNIQAHYISGLQNWTELVRKSRNAIHFGVQLDTEINYEKTAIILLASIDNFKTIYALKSAADNAVPSLSPHLKV